MPIKSDLEARIEGATRVDVWNRFFDPSSVLYEWTILQQEWLNVSLRELFDRGRARCLANFDRLMTDSVRKTAFDFLIQHSLETRTRQYKWAVQTPLATVFERNTFPVPIRNWLQKQSLEDIAPEAIRVVSYVDSEDFYDVFFANTLLSYSMGGEVALAEFNIPIQFELRDPLVEAIAENSCLRLSSSISSQVSDRVKAALLEGLRNGEAMELIRDRVNQVWDRPLIINVDPLVDPGTGEILRRGYSYSMSSKTWSFITSRTEVLRWFNDGKLEAYKQCGVKYVQYMATDDHRTCPDCIAYHNQVFTVAESAGLLPLHCRCRCTWIPVIGEPELVMFEIAGVAKRASLSDAKMKWLVSKAYTPQQDERMQQLASVNAGYTYNLSVPAEQVYNPFNTGTIEHAIFEMMRGVVERKPLEEFVTESVGDLQTGRETIRSAEQKARAKRIVISRLKGEEYRVSGATAL